MNTEDKLRECVEFYANPKNWEPINQLANARIVRSDQENITPMFKVGGKLAREVLKELETSKSKQPRGGLDGCA